MWKKDEATAETPAGRPEATRGSDAPTRGRTPRNERATIGPSIAIRGEVTGDEDLLIQGRVDGSVDLDQHAVTVGPEGEVKASITARVVTVEGSVKGNLTAEEQVILRSSARVQGDIAAPRVVLEDGASFRGGVDMGDAGESVRRPGDAPATQATKPSEAGRTPEPGKMPEPGKAATQVTHGSTSEGKGSTDSATRLTR
jgi:cytoskeletal protein CcmA (bactofilin family)